MRVMLILTLIVGFVFTFSAGNKLGKETGYEKGWNDAADFVDKMGLCNKRICLRPPTKKEVE